MIVLLLAGDLQPHADESNYLYLAACWNHFGFYSDAVYYLWPPAYPFVVAVALDWFGAGGVFALKLFQVLVSGLLGAVIMLTALRLFNRRAAVIAGAVWACYLPLIGFTHYLWPETIFLAVFAASVYLFLIWWQEAEDADTHPFRLLGAGVLFGVGLLIKEVALYLCPVLCVLVILRRTRLSLQNRLSSAVLFVLSVAVVVAPWTLRNHEVYGRFVPVGATLGKNVYMGLNAYYYNLDYPSRHRPQLAEANDSLQKLLVGDPPPAWLPDNKPNIIDRLTRSTQQGLEFARQHPGYTARSRVKRVADWVAPTSFFLRHYGLGRYQGVLAEPGLRRPLFIAAVFLPVLVLIGAIPGLLLALRDPTGRMLLITIVVYVAVAAAPLMGMSRYRLMIDPFLIVAASGFAAGFGRPWWTRKAAAICVVAAWLVLAILWWIDCREVIEYLTMVW
ncbi:MAG TPA: glycosyltransferase family 39 protein [Phycisphaerae bacterium]|nr:glycosyltransferase family 39 protein [Phycisphaerae bacterium]